MHPSYDNWIKSKGFTGGRWMKGRQSNPRSTKHALHKKTLNGKRQGKKAVHPSVAKGCKRWHGSQRQSAPTKETGRNFGRIPLFCSGHGMGADDAVFFNPQSPLQKQRGLKSPHVYRGIKNEQG
jgi:hypothetical protein